MAGINVSIDEKANELVIRMPLQTPTPSASGKTMVVATTRGNLRTDAKVNGKELTIGVNAYYSNK